VHAQHQALLSPAVAQSNANNSVRIRVRALTNLTTRCLSASDALNAHYTSSRIAIAIAIAIRPHPPPPPPP
jgi:hypothetical protein